MGLYKRGALWWMRFSVQGKQIRRSTGTTDRRLADKVYKKVLGEIAEGDWFDRLPGEEKTLSELFDKYLDEHSKPNKSSKSYIRDKAISIRMLKEFGDVTLIEIGTEQIFEYKKKRRAGNLAPASLNKELAFIRHAFEMAVLWGWLDVNPVSRIPREKVKNRMERWLTGEEEERLLNSCPEWLRDMVIFALNTGFRQNEMLPLTWNQVDWDRKAILFWDQKNNGRDTVPINEKAIEVLKRIGKVKSLSSGHVFLTSNGTPFIARNVVRSFSLALEKAKITNFRWHDLRHTFATRLVHAGVDLYTVQRLGRWRSLSMVMRYAHHNLESLRTGMEAVNRLASTSLAQSGE